MVETLKQAQIDYTNTQAEILKAFDETMAQATATRDDAFAQASEKLNEALKEARDEYLQTVTEIKDAFLEQIKELENGLGGLGVTVQKFLDMLNSLSGGTSALGAKAATIATFPQTSGGTNTTPIIQTLPKPGALTAMRGTTINLNVKTDSTQSPSMVGSAISKAINKYTGGGGGVRTGFIAQ